MALPLIVDSHCHLDVDTFADEIDEVVARAERAGVARMVTISQSSRDHDKNLAIAERFPSVFLGTGTHPHRASEEPDLSVDWYVTASEHPKVVAIGEAGLDYHYDRSPREQQAQSFRTQLEAGRQTGLPVIVHTREADEDTASLIEEAAAKGPVKGVLHCFSSGRELAERAIAAGFYVSLSGILTFKKAEALRDIVRDLPMDRLIVETDAPFLAPIPKRGKRNEPAYVVHTHAALAELKGLSVEDCATATTENFFCLFDKVSPPSTEEIGSAAAAPEVG